MKGDFSRNTFDPRSHFSRVLKQQGRVELDADFNEQVAIFWHYLRTLATDLIGPAGGPDAACAFWVVADPKLLGLPANQLKKLQERLAKARIWPTDREIDFLLTPGRYYVDGILCENHDYVSYSRQPDLPEPTALRDNITYLLYLDVFELLHTHIQDDCLREVALGGPDTAARAKVIWQAKVVEVANLSDESFKQAWKELLFSWQRPDRGLLRAKAREPEGAEHTDPCITSPDARYRGPENQLYRVEIHNRGDAGSATFKWSRENGSVAFPIRSLQGSIAVVEYLGRDDRLTLQVDDWVEIVDDAAALSGTPGPLVQVEEVDPAEGTVTLATPAGVELPVYEEDETSSGHPLLRRWDHRAGLRSEGGLDLADDGALPVEEDQWIVLEDGIEVFFEEGHRYRSGDYWLIPARTITGDVEWPGEGEPEALPPHGVEHHYAPLAIFNTKDGKVDPTTIQDRRCRFEPLECLSQFIVIDEH